MKKFVAFVITGIMILGLAPAVSAVPVPPPAGSDLPWQQRPVSDSSIVVGAGSGGESGLYNLNIMWSRPHLTSVLDPQATTDHGRLQSAAGTSFWTLFPTHYNVRFRNATRGDEPDVNPFLPLIRVEAPGNGQDRNLPTGTRLEVSTGPRDLRMSPGRLYEILIHPSRNVPVDNDPVDGIITIRGEEAAIDNTPILPPGRELVFLTDINVRARGRGNTITVTWDNPSWGGTPFFPFWQITRHLYQPDTGILPGAGVTTTVPVTALTVNAEDGTLSYTWEDPRIRRVGQYVISVEPAFGASPGDITGHNVRQGGHPGAPPRLYAPVPAGTVPGRNLQLHFTQNPFRTTMSMIPEFMLEQAGADFVRLFWEDLNHLMGAGVLTAALERVYVEQWPADMEGQVPPAGGSPPVLVTISGSEFLRINEIFVGPGIPRERRGFALALRFTDGTVLHTEVVVFDPLHVPFSPYRPEIVSIGHAGGGAISMQWLAFARFPAVFEEEVLIPPGDPYNGRFVDDAMFYEIFVSDSWDAMQHLTTPLLTITPAQLHRSQRLSLLEPAPVIPRYDPTWELFPFDNIRQYQALTGDGIEIRDIRGNRAYFVRIRAVRGEPGNRTQHSNWAYGSVYIPPLHDLEVTPQMIPSPPVEIPADADAAITTTSIPLRWDSRYLEIMWPRGRDVTGYPDRDLWSTVIGVHNNRLIHGRSASQINFIEGADPTAPARHEFLNRMISPALRNRLLGIGDFPLNPNLPEQVAPFLNEARDEIRSFTMSRWNYGFTDNPMALRIQNTDDFRYQIHVAPYATVRNHPGGFEGFRNSITGWTSIGQPTVTNGVKNHVVTDLEPNGTFVIFIRPYVVADGREIHAAYPTFVIGTTILTPDRTVPDPSTPVLIPVPEDTTRSRIGVRWRVQASMIYELRVSQFLTDYPDGGVIIPITHEHIQAVQNGETVELENPQAVLRIKEVNGEPYFHLRIHERFPATTYYVWARAQGVTDEGEAVGTVSHPSNPVDIHTNDIEPPAPPRSLARVPQNLLALYNRYNEADYANDEPEAMTISFMRIFEDLRDIMGNLTPRAEAGTAEGGNVRALNLPNLGATEAYAAIHIIRFEDLIANREYYVRARTILTVQRGQPDVFSYEIELADNEDFLDSVLYTIPPLVAEDPINTRRAASVWVQIELFTGVSDDEFDGVHRPDQYPLPERDFEITYDHVTQTLTWRFRTNQRGADGRLDQNADQRFITRLIQDNVFVFTIDLSHYNGLPVSNREVILPESILRAFDGRRITLEILADEKNIAIPPGAFDTAQIRAIQPGIGTYYRIALNAQQDGMAPLVTNTAFATVPQRLTVTATNNRQRVANMSTFARPIIVELPVERHMTPAGLATGLFVLDTNTASWRDTVGDFSFMANSLSSGIQTPTTFAGITRTMPVPVVPQSPENAAMARVSTRLVITDMPNFDPARIVTANEFNNIVNALATGSTSVTMGAVIPPATVSSLNRARLHAPADPTHAAALDIMVRLYQTRTRQVLTPMTEETSIPGIQNVDPALRRNMAIASDIGFLTGPIDPGASLTLGQMLHMADIIILDAV